MIYCVEGTPGVGKTLYFVSKLIPDYLRIKSHDGSFMPVHIWTNIEGLKPSILLALNKLPESISMFIHNIGECVDDEGRRTIDKRYLEWFYYDPNTIEWVQDVDPKSKRTYWHPNFETAAYLPLNSVIILDELQNVFGSRDFDKPFTQACLPYITRHRHYGHNIFWASQNHEQVDVTFRRNTEQVWHLEGLDNFALFGGSQSFKIQKYEGKFAGVQIGVPPYAVETIAKDKRYYNAYKSHVSGEVIEKKHTSNMFLNSKPLRIVAFLMLLCLVLLVVGGNPLDKFKIKSTAASAPVATPAPSTGLAPMGVGERSGGGVPAPDTTACYVNSYINAGRIKLLLNNGKSVFMEGNKYEPCR